MSSDVSKYYNTKYPGQVDWVSYYEDHPRYYECSKCGTVIKCPGDCIPLDGLCKSCNIAQEREYEKNQKFLASRYRG